MLSTMREISLLDKGPLLKAERDKLHTVETTRGLPKIVQIMYNSFLAGCGSH